MEKYCGHVAWNSIEFMKIFTRVFHISSFLHPEWPVGQLGTVLYLRVISPNLLHGFHDLSPLAYKTCNEDITYMYQKTFGYYTGKVANISKNAWNLKLWNLWGILGKVQGISGSGIHIIKDKNESSSLWQKHLYR